MHTINNNRTADGRAASQQASHGYNLLFIFREEQQHYPVLTGIRGFAALWVLLYHAWVLAKPRPVIVDIWDWQVDLTPFFPAVRAVSSFFLCCPDSCSASLSLSGRRDDATAHNCGHTCGDG